MNIVVNINTKEHVCEHTLQKKLGILNILNFLCSVYMLYVPQLSPLHKKVKDI